MSFGHQAKEIWRWMMCKTKQFPNPRWLLSATLLMSLMLAMVPMCLTAKTTQAASPPGLEWDRTFGGSNLDTGRCVQPTADGGYVVAGSTSSFGAGGSDVWLIKTDASGNKLWDWTFGGSNPDAGHSVQMTADGGYIVCGSTESFGAGGSDVWLIKTDALGNKLWDRTFGGSNEDWGQSVQQTTDGGYIVAGATWSYGAGSDDVWLIKTDALGNELWDRTFGGSAHDYGYSVQQTVDAGYLVAGGTNSYGAGGSDVWLIKTDASGNKVWDRTFGGLKPDIGHSVQQTAGGYAVAGITASYGAGYDDVWLITTDALGNKLWDRTFGGPNEDWGESVWPTADGGYVVAGTTMSYGAGGTDAWLIKTDASGNKQWDGTFGGSNLDAGYSVQQTADGGYIVAGETWSYGAGWYDVWLFKTMPADTTPPSVAMVSPPSGSALQDGVNFIASATDSESGVSSVTFSIREANGGERTPIGFEDIPGTYDAATGNWTLGFDTLQLPDCYYVVLVKATDNAGNIGSITVPYSIRNWAILELLPSSENNKAGRTMPVKFSLRVAASVDSTQPFVYSENLTIKIFATSDPGNILQTSVFGTGSRDYRIDIPGQKYITNFKTSKVPKQYTVEIWRTGKDFLIGSFTFKTVK